MLLMDIVLSRNRLMSANLMSLLYHCGKPAVHMCLCMLTCLFAWTTYCKFQMSAFTNIEQS